MIAVADSTVPHCRQIGLDTTTGVGACAITGAGIAAGAGLATAGAAFTTGLCSGLDEVGVFAGGGAFLTMAGFSTSSCTAFSLAAEPVAALADRAARSRSSTMADGANTALMPCGRVCM